MKRISRFRLAIQQHVTETVVSHGEDVVRAAKCGNVSPKSHSRNMHHADVLERLRHEVFWREEAEDESGKCRR